MKTFGGFFLILLIAVAGSAQAGAQDCPQISVSSDSRSPSLRDQIPYTLSMTGESAGSALEFAWTTSNGKITRGQGTREVTVGEWTYEGGIAVTVKIRGLSDGCPNTASVGRAIHPPMHGAGYIGPTTYCTDKRIRWDTKGDLASVLKGKLDGLKME